MSSAVPPDNAHYRRLRELVDRADDLPATEWAPFLERECGTDTTLRDEAMRLLEQVQAASSEGFLEPSPSSANPSPVTRTHHYPVRGSEWSGEVGKYKIVRRFSESSGQAAAYLAFDPDVERHVVLKRYHSGADGKPDESDEGRALARVNSPYVARCHGIERIAGELFLIVEYVPGRNLAEVQRDGPLGVAQVVRVLAQLTEGVAAVHARGLIHRDIKPANVILHDDGAPRLVDFGLAAHLGSRRLRELSGTPAYMAPEQARGEWDRIDHRVDVYGLGALLYKLLTGHAPNKGETVEQARKADVKAPRLLDPAIPVWLETICLKALAAAPENRYASAEEFRQALLRGEGRDESRFPIRTRWAAAAAVLGLVALAFIGWLRPWRSATNGDVANVAVSPLQAEMAVSHFQDVGDKRQVLPLGEITAASLEQKPPRFKDLVRVRVTLSRPAYCYLIALNPDGKDQLCIREVPDRPEALRRVLEFPENPKDFFGLTDGVGLQAFVVVASDRPLPEYEAWKSQDPGGFVWATIDADGLWTYDGGAAAASRATGRLRGEIVQREAAPAPLVTFCDRLRQRRDVALVRAVAFPVKTDREIIK
jgi:Protein kinase domain